MKKNFGILVIVSFTILLLLPLNVWSFSEKVTFSGLTQTQGVKALEGYLSKQGKKDKYAGLLDDLMRLSKAGVETDTFIDLWHMYLTVNPNLMLVRQDGTVVGDEVCQGDVVSLQRGADKGEFWNDGGDVDTPPVYWVEDAEDKTMKILEKIASLYKSGQYVPSYNTWMKTGGEGRPCNFPYQATYKDDLSGLQIYSGSTYLKDNSLATRAGVFPVDGAVVCSLNKKAETAMGMKSFQGGYMVESQNGTAYLNANYELKCTYYVYQVGTGTLGKCFLVQAPSILISDSLGDFILGMVTDYASSSLIVKNYGYNKSLKVSAPASVKTEMEVIGLEDLAFGDPTALRVLVKNTGNAELTLKKAFSSDSYKFVSCDPVFLKPGAQGECIISVTPRAGKGLSIGVEYEYKSCGKTKNGSSSVNLLESKRVSPSASSQVYSISVHGGCENSFYGCSSPDADGDFLVGYKCNKKTGEYYSPAAERFMLKYELPSIPSNKVLGGSLNLVAGGVTRPMELALYSTARNWKPASCTAGGDICEQPYCGECADLFNINRVKIATSSPVRGGRVSFDVSEYIRNAYQNSESEVSFQIAGDEDLWAVQGESTCGKLEAWTRQDVSILASGADAPALEIVFK